MPLTPIPAYPPRAHRMHEACGPGAYFFAFATAAQIAGTLLWIREQWRAEQINPMGFADMVDPDKVLVASTRDQVEVLAAAEEALRSGVVPCVVLELSKPLSLTAGRRLQLAAKAGASTALAVIPEGMGSNAAETRWQCKPVFDGADSTLHCWELIKNKSGTLGAWHVRWAQSTRRITVVSEAGKRSGSAGAAR